MNRILFILVGIMLLSTTIVNAIPINYTFTGTATGSVNGEYFPNSEVTITASADTENVFFDEVNIYYVISSLAMIDIADVGSGELTREILVFNLEASNYSFVGLQQDNMDIVTVENPELELYDLKTSFGPVSYGYLSMEGLFDIPTSMGTVVFDSSGEFTFEATLQDVDNFDSDDDGVLDTDDACIATPLGEVVNAEGCSIDELCPCSNPIDGNKWKNHGAYVRCITHTSDDFVSTGFIIEIEKDVIVAGAGKSKCGRKK